MAVGSLTSKESNHPANPSLKSWNGLDQEKEPTLPFWRLWGGVTRFLSVQTMWRSTGQHWWQEIWLSRNRKAAVKRLGRTSIPSDHKEASYLHRYTTQRGYNSYQLISESASTPRPHTWSYYFRNKCESRSSDNVRVLACLRRHAGVEAFLFRLNLTLSRASKLANRPLVPVSVMFVLERRDKRTTK